MTPYRRKRQPGNGLQRVSGLLTVRGHRPDDFPTRARGEADHVWPEFLPDGHTVLFTITAVSGGLGAAQIVALDLRTGSA